MITTDQKLRAVEALIEDMKAAGDHDVDVFKAIAKDIRARLAGSPSVAIVELERRMAAAHRSKTLLGYGNGELVGIGQELICRWPCVKQALEKFGANPDD